MVIRGGKGNVQRSLPITREEENSSVKGEKGGKKRFTCCYKINLNITAQGGREKRIS